MRLTMQNLVSCHFASQVESGMEEHWEWENLGSKKKSEAQQEIIIMVLH